LSNIESAVEVKGLVKIYEKKVKALDGTDLTVKAGKVFSLLGPNGAGKTTLMRILTTQLRPTSGEAYVFGLNISRDGNKIRKIIGYVPQEMSVWTDISGYENLLIYAKIYGIPPTYRKKLILDVLEKMGLRDVADNLVKTYSGGMIRRLEIACTMLTRPKILFLDEPTIGLDPSARKAVWEELLSIRKEYGTTIFFNTHYMDEADLYSDEIAIINEGKIVKLGTAEELKHSVRGEVIIMNIDDGVNKEVLEEIKKLDLVNEVILNGMELSIVADEAGIVLPKVMEVLRRYGIKVYKTSITKPTLDDVFLKYAGTRLEAVGRIGEVRQLRRMIKRG